MKSANLFFVDLPVVFVEPLDDVVEALERVEILNRVVVVELDGFDSVPVRLLQVRLRIQDAVCGALDSVCALARVDGLRLRLAHIAIAEFRDALLLLFTVPVMVARMAVLIRIQCDI